MVCAAASALDKSSASPSSFAVGTFARMEAMASFTRASLRPLTMTRVPSAASALAMAKPIPAVEPLTRASLFSSWRFIGLKSGVVNQTIARAFSCYAGRGTTFLHVQLTEKPRTQKCDNQAD